jgi:SAM-dependent methyltransferase
MPAASGFYARRVFPWLNDKLGADAGLQRLRADALAAARGSVVEIGFGSGMSLPHYPAAVRELVAVEPSDGMLDRAQPRLRALPFTVQVVQAPAESLPFPDAHFDTAVSVLTLCSVAEPERVLRELHRVLRADGRLIVVEHGLADDAGIAVWQRRLDGLQTRLACGCHLTRPIAALLQRAGFRVDALQRAFAPGMPRTHGWVTSGVAAKA